MKNVCLLYYKKPGGLKKKKKSLVIVNKTSGMLLDCLSTFQLKMLLCNRSPQNVLSEVFLQLICPSVTAH